MILDELNEIADAASVAAEASTILVGDQIDLGLAGRGLGGDKALYLVVTVDTEVITGGNAGTLVLSLVSDAQAAIAVDGSATVHAVSPTFVTDDAAANSALLNVGSKLWVVQLPIEGNTYERYLGLLATIGTTTITAGAISAYLTADVADWKAYDAPFQL